MKQSYESETFVHYGWKDFPFESHERSRSPDGSKVASWSRLGQITEPTGYTLSVTDADGTVREVLGSVPFGEWVAFSPDGKKLALGAVLDPDQKFDLFTLRYLSLFVMDLQTKKLQELVRGNVSPLNYSDQIWSPDSMAILYQTRDHEIAIYDFVTGTSHLLTKGEHATWSPQGDLIAFQGGDKHYYAVKPDGTEKRLLLRNRPQVFGEFYGPLLWSPTGQYLAVQKQRLSLSEISDYYVLDIRTRQLTKIRPN